MADRPWPDHGESGPRPVQNWTHSGRTGLRWADRVEHDRSSDRDHRSGQVSRSADEGRGLHRDTRVQHVSRGTAVTSHRPPAPGARRPRWESPSRHWCPEASPSAPTNSGSDLFGLAERLVHLRCFDSDPHAGRGRRHPSVASATRARAAASKHRRRVAHTAGARTVVPGEGDCCALGIAAQLSFRLGRRSSQRA